MIVRASIAAMLLTASAAQAFAEQVVPLPDPVTQLNDVEFDAQFRCPESLAEADRNQAVRDYVGWAKVQHPEWGIQNLIAARVKLLQRHQCTESLDAIRNGGEKQR